MTRLSEEEVSHAVDVLFVYLRDVLYYPRQASLEPDELPEPFRELAQGLLFIGTCIEEERSLVNELGKGNLDTTIQLSSENEIASGLKSLQATLKHISWQVGQIAKGDYNQRLSYAGAFSDSINDMILQLKERDKALRAEISLTQQLAADSRNTVLLLEGITKSIEELIIVVDRSTYEWLYTNRDPLLYLQGEEGEEEIRALLNLKINEYHNILASKLDGTEAPLQCQLELTGEGGFLAQVLSVSGYPITWMERKSIVLKLKDVTQTEREREKLEQVAYYDELTNAYSRHYGMLILERWITEKQEFVIAFVDMDGLKYVNDTYGHAAGDEYILATTQALSCFSRQSVICRLGGDEFMLLLRKYSLEQVNENLEKMRTKLAEEAGYAYDRSFSFGLVEVKKDNAMSASLLLSMADESMYEDKRDRKKERRAQC